ncbi:MAG: proline dehydrogenase family protein [Bacteroidia bacterium]|nr:proline dehydrogenase family protein [Bacteroidia bacterium]
MFGALLKNPLPEISFDNTEVAFADKSDADLRRALWLFRFIGNPALVKFSAPFVTGALKAGLPVKGIVRNTVFRHFCGGENINECDHAIAKLWKSHIGTILDFSVEGQELELDFENTCNEILLTIDKAAGNERIPFSVFKMTGIARLALLEKINSAKQLSAEEEKEFGNIKKRVEKICSRAFEKNVPVFIDAEETWIQSGLDGLALEMMMRFNKEKAIVFNTVQLYRTDRLPYLEKMIAHARAEKYVAAYKLVRGAYHEKETQRAVEMEYKIPVHQNKSKTDNDYNKAQQLCVENIDRVSFCSGTHNEESCRQLVSLMEEKNIPLNHPHIWFAQLYGMSDHISYNLSRAGYNVAKYVPYGKIESVLPYLIRRAQENKSVAGQSSRELSLIMMELKRRKEFSA